MYSLWWPNHVAPAHVSKVAKNFACCVWKTSQECIGVSCYDDLRYEKINLTHTQS